MDQYNAESGLWEEGRSPGSELRRRRERILDNGKELHAIVRYQKISGCFARKTSRALYNSEKGSWQPVGMRSIASISVMFCSRKMNAGKHTAYRASQNRTDIKLCRSRVPAARGSGAERLSQDNISPLLHIEKGAAEACYNDSIQERSDRQSFSSSHQKVLGKCEGSKKVRRFVWGDRGYRWSKFHGWGFNFFVLRFQKNGFLSSLVLYALSFELYSTSSTIRIQ